MVKRNIVQKRLKKLDEFLEILKNLQKYSFVEFSTEPERYGSAERFLHLAIETMTDIGNHIVADDYLGEVNWYSDIPRILAENDYIDSDLSETWIQMIGFRNILVHDYADIDLKIVYDVLKNHLDDIKMIRNFFAQYL